MTDIYYYGAKGDGSTDDSAALAAYFSAANTYGFPVVLPKKTFVVNTGLNIANGMVVVSHGATLKTTSDSVVILSANAVNDFSIQGKLTLQGTRTASGQSAAGGGLYISGCNRYMIDKLRVENFKGCGVEIAAGTSVNPRGDQGLWSMISVRDCNTGLKIGIGTGAEYNIFTNFQITGCDKAQSLAAGNTVMVAGNVVDNTAGVELLNGTNHGHGIHSGVNINHNANYNITAAGITQGYTFNGCHIYGDSASAGKIIMDGCSGIQLVGGVIDSVIQNDTSGVNAVIGNFKAGSTYNVTGSSSGSCKRAYNFDSSGLLDVTSGSNELPVGGTAGQVLKKNSTTDYDVVWGTDNVSGGGGSSPTLIVQAHRTGSNQAVSVATTLIFNTEDLDSLNAYDNTTGIFTAPSSGLYMFDVSCEVDGGTITGGGFLTFWKKPSGGSDATDSYGPESLVNTNIIVGGCSKVIQLGTGDQVRVTFTSYYGSSMSFVPGTQNNIKIVKMS